MKKYAWIIEWISVALLVSLAVVSVISQVVVLYSFGILFIIFGLLRIVPLFKTTNSKLIKGFMIGETVIDTLCGIFLLISAINNKDFSNYKITSYLVAFVIYLRGFIYFLSTAIKNEPSTLESFFIHIILLTLGTAIFVKGGFSQTVFAWILFAMVLICSAYLVLHGYKGYKSYRSNLAGKHLIKNLNKESKKEKKEKEKQEKTEDKKEKKEDFQEEKSL